MKLPEAAQASNYLTASMLQHVAHGGKNVRVFIITAWWLIIQVLRGYLASNFTTTRTHSNSKQPPQLASNKIQ